MRTSIIVHKPLVCVIDSPHKSELDEETHEGKSLSDALTLSRIRNKYYRVTDWRQLEAAVFDFSEFALPGWKQDETTGINQIHWNSVHLHLSCHGNTEGIHITNDDAVIEWWELGELVKLLASKVCFWRQSYWKVATVGITMSSCFGAHAKKMATPEFCPFIHVVGTDATLAYSDALIAFSTFYQQLINKKRTLKQALAAMNQAALPTRPFEVITPADIGIPGFEHRDRVGFMMADERGKFSWIFDTRISEGKEPHCLPKDDYAINGKQLPYFDDATAAMKFMLANRGQRCMVEVGAMDDINRRLEWELGPEPPLANDDTSS